MAQSRILAQDSVCKLVQNGDLAKTLNTLRTVPGAKNPFVTSRPGGVPMSQATPAPQPEPRQAESKHQG